MLEASKLIRKHVAMQEIKDRLHGVAHQPGAVVVDSISYGPCLLLSRECGSGGVGIARQVGKRFGWNVFDREIVDEIARIAHERERLIESVDEHVRSYWDRTWREVLTASDNFDEKYLRYLRQVVLSLGYHGAVVIVGRGAQFLLPPPCALRVRLVAPLAQRVKRVAERQEFTVEEARLRVKEFDAARTAFIRKVFKANADSPLNYDLVINTGEISLNAAVEIVAVALREKLGARPVEAGHVVK